MSRMQCAPTAPAISPEANLTPRNPLQRVARIVTMLSRREPAQRGDCKFCTANYYQAKQLSWGGYSVVRSTTRP